ncbi:hypothetical protein BDF21DRAFT_410606 [Thamnidium elegans]|nr:hypothetical protein BDF21DRAFT_410606 [Thamnidium elegans]
METISDIRSSQRVFVVICIYVAIIMCYIIFRVFIKCMSQDNEYYKRFWPPFPFFKP